MKSRILRTAVILATAATLFYSGCGDNGASSDVRGGGNVDALINRTRGTNDPKKPDLYTLNVIKSPESGGSVSKSPDKEQYTSGESVLVSATPETGYRFTGWSGSQTSTNTEIAITMNGNKELIANFLPVNVATYTLTVTPNPATGGTVSKSPDKLEYASGESVLVTAIPEHGYAFTGWSGASASKDAAVTITVDDSKELIANFALQTYTLTINSNPPDGGSVSSDPGKSAYTYNEQVTVTATAREGYEFTGWSGASSSTNASVTVTMNGNKELTAGFRQTGIVVPPSASYTLTVSASPANGGTVSTNPSKTSYSANENVYVTAEAAEGYKFIRWSSASASQNAGITIAMDGNKELIAIFEILTYTLTVSATPSSYGSVSRDPNWTNYSHGTTVTVTASANSGYKFTGWTGESSSTNPAINITMDGNKTLTANFQQDNTFVDGRDGKTYRTVTINGVTWMAENLNFAAEGSKCYGEDGQVYDNGSRKTLTSAEVAANCAKYGRLYNWETARAACPVGWHLPSDAEWTALENAVGGADTAGTKLKATSGWYNNGNGSDDYGFSALPGGGGFSDGSFDDGGYNGSWWSATELDANIAWLRNMSYGYEFVYRFNLGKSGLVSVRCVED